jgi:phosphate starvation-inducible protein PhoH
MKSVCQNKKNLRMRVQAVTHQQMKKHLKRVKMNCKMTINNLFKAIIIKDWVKSLK